MLSSATVNRPRPRTTTGRGTWPGRTANGLALLALGAALAIPLIAQVPPESTVERELGERIAEAVAPLTDVLLVVGDASGQGAVKSEIEREVAGVLRARGIRLVEQPGDRTAAVRVKCAASLVENVCFAEVRKGDRRSVVLASRPRVASAGGSALPAAVLNLTPVFAARDRILDLVEVGDRQLLVLDARSITLYRHEAGGWDAARTVPLVGTSAWPRDARGRLEVKGQNVEAFLPNQRCRGGLETFDFQCAEAVGAHWPVGVPGSVLEAGRNYFRAPRTPSFFSAAAIGSDNTSGWLLATVAGTWQLITSTFDVRQSMKGLGDDVAGLTSQCGSGRQVVAALADHAAVGMDALRAFEVTNGAVTAFTPAAALPGNVTALWPAPGQARALVVVENRDAQSHEAFYAGIACAR